MSIEKAKVYSSDGTDVIDTLDMPELFNIELRSDLVRHVHTNVRMNKRQPYGVSKYAGMQHSAQGWGTGRAVARVPRVRASGTRRGGQAAFANFARKGRMAFPLSPNRKWTRKTNNKLRRLVCCMGIAASGNPAIVEGRGHEIGNIASFPIVVDENVKEIEKTKDAFKTLVSLGLGNDLKRVKDSKTIRPGKGKWRNRRYVQRKGVLIVHDDNEHLRAFRGITGVELVNVNNLNLLYLCPGGELGRLIIYTRTAFAKLGAVFSNKCKKGFTLPEKMISCDDLNQYFYSDEIQALLGVPNLLRKSVSCKKTDQDYERIQKMVSLYENE